MSIKRNQRGFTLIEVLIAVVIFSVGLLGLAAMMVTSVKTNHASYLRTQASHLAQGMADRIRSNRSQINTYNGVYSANTPISNPCTGTGVCSATQMVQRDLSVWGQQARALLPNAELEVQCLGNLRRPAGAMASASPYNGLCTILMRWDESSLQVAATSPDRQVFAWVFEP